MEVCNKWWILFAVLLSCVLQFGSCRIDGADRPQLCALKSYTGHCQASFRRFFFNVDTGYCEMFVWGGCQKNANNFMTFEACVAMCGISNDMDPCLFGKSTGPCEGLFPRYFFDIASQQCKSFIYGGCLGNANNFRSMGECHLTCEVRNDKDPCLFGKSTGPCEGAYTRYYFDSASQQCKSFLYGGCLGTANNFQSMAECQLTCQD